MVWSFLDRGQVVWPADLDRAKYTKANKGSVLEPIFVELDEARKVWGQNALPLPPTSTRNHDRVDDWAALARGYAAGPHGKKVITRLTNVVLAASTLERLKVVERDRKTIQLGPESLAALKKIRLSSDLHAKCLSAAVLEPQIAAIEQRLHAAVDAKVLADLADVLRAYREVVASRHSEYTTAKKLLSEWPTDQVELAAAQTALATALTDGSRRMTQTLGNIDKSLKAGTNPATIGLDPRAVKAIGKTMTVLDPWANGNSNAAVKKMDRSELIDVVKLLAKHAAVFDEIGARLP